MVEKFKKKKDYFMTCENDNKFTFQGLYISFIRTQPCLFIQVLFTAVLARQQQSCPDVTDHVWLAKKKIPTCWGFVDSLVNL